MNFLFNWKNIIGGSDSDGFEDDFPDCISQGEFEDDDNDYATNYAESLMSSSQSEFEDDAEDFMVNYTESLTSNWNEFEDDAEDFVVNYAESLMSNQNSIRETDENFLDDDRIVSHYNGYEDTDEDYDEEGALPSCYFEDGDYLKPQNYQETEYHDCLLDIEGRDENNISKGKSKEKIKQGDAVGSKTEGKRHRKLKMQQLEGIFLERIPVRNVCGNLFYFDGRSYKRADAQELKTLLRSVLPQKVIEAISGMFQYHEVVEYIKINPELTLDAREFPYRKEKNYISFKNMVVDAKTMKLYKHQSEFPLFFRIRAEFQKEPDATPVFDGFLAAISGEDKEIECLILEMLGYEKFRIKYELCEIILCNVNDTLRAYGFTVMDGPFFSIMPFGKTGLHSLTSVTFTPHATSYDPTPTFACQHSSGTDDDRYEIYNDFCSPRHLGNCNDCKAKPESAFPYMANLARKYLREEYAFEYKESLFSMKPILMSSEIDDSRPTVVRTYSVNPTCVGVLSGKINTVYDLDDVLE